MRCFPDGALINTCEVDVSLVLDERPRVIRRNVAACVGGGIRGLIHGCKRFLLRAILQLLNPELRLFQYSPQVLLDLYFFALPRVMLEIERDGGCL